MGLGVIDAWGGMMFREFVVCFGEWDGVGLRGFCGFFVGLGWVGIGLGWVGF